MGRGLKKRKCSFPGEANQSRTLARFETTAPYLASPIIPLSYQVPPHHPDKISQVVFNSGLSA